jgi:RNA recognition motif-containing protein
MALLRTIPCSTQFSTKQHFDFENKKHSSTNPFFSSSSFHSLRLSISHHTPTTTFIRTKQHSNSTLTFTSTSEQVTTQEQQQDTEEQKEEEEVSTTRLLAQNFPWTSTAQDVRTLFEKYGKVVDVEVLFLLFLHCFVFFI